ncbi:hypothetical protein FRC12_006353 [Ceratobasidium sp. 428]|nr:hypothetical protein FRC12_006353 [Ceratobasidium sp. 428]
MEKSQGVSGLVYVPRAKKAAKVRERVGAIIVSSDTEGGQPVGEDGDEDEDDEDEDNVPWPRISGATYVSSDVESDASFVVATTSSSTRRRASFLVDGNESETGTGSERSESSETDTDRSESDFDWTQYNGRYHPHDRVSSSGSKLTQPKESPPKRTNPVPRSQVGRGAAPIVRLVPRPPRVVSAPIPVVAPVKRPHIVVELPLPAKRPRVKSNPTKPRILGDHNTLRQANSFSEPRRLSDHKTQSTSAISRLCQRFSSMSSADDRDYMAVDENEEPARMDTPLSDDMDLFQAVTPMPREVKVTGRVMRC